jgi:hypothetical protein
VVVEPSTDRRLPLRRAQITQADVPAEPVRWAEGPLQKLYDSWSGKKRPVAEAGFGLPELYLLLAAAVGRHVPANAGEAAAIQSFYRVRGPLPRHATENAFQSIRRELAPGHPLALYLEAFAARLHQSDRRKTP